MYNSLSNNSVKRDKLLLIFIISCVWMLSPFISVFFILLFVFSYKVNYSELKYLCFLIALAFGLLAFTQRSLALGDTDIVRYYNAFEPFVQQNLSLSDIFSMVYNENILTYTFSFINIFLVSALRNVQYISLFWVCLTYYLYFVSVIKVFRYENIAFSKLNNFLLLFFSVFCILIFVQITETIKNAAAFSIFFYLLTLFIYENPSKAKMLLGLFLGIGVHSSLLMLLPLFFYKFFNTKFLSILFIIIVAICPFINIMEIAGSILPDFGIFSSLILKSNYYAMDAASNSSIRYILISVAILLMGIYLVQRRLFTKENKYINLVLLYLIIMYLNYNNSNGFLRFANFSSFIIAFEFAQFLWNKRKNALVLCVIISFFFASNLLITYSRTRPGGYASSYMDNSLSRIFFSTTYDYLTYRYK